MVKDEKINNPAVESDAEEDAEVIGDESLQSKGERKARKALSKLGLKRVEGITRVTLKRARNQLFVVARPEVFKSGSDTYVVFGEIKVEDMAQTMAQAQRDFAAQNLAASDILDGAGADDEAPELAEEAVDESGVEEKDIELVMSQANVTRTKAVKALKANDNDIVNAIMELTL
ncbi:nascent polypeptide-associated complex subunit alpha [Obelidium mucronatum]|nr:nascent polypeptide-associated complex subunit alpha [Obelidium mucronatum]